MSTALLILTWNEVDAVRVIFPKIKKECSPAHDNHPEWLKTFSTGQKILYDPARKQFLTGFKLRFVKPRSNGVPTII